MDDCDFWHSQKTKRERWVHGPAANLGTPVQAAEPMTCSIASADCGHANGRIDMLGQLLIIEQLIECPSLYCIFSLLLPAASVTSLNYVPAMDGLVSHPSDTNN
jgi:hypothetical protein